MQACRLCSLWEDPASEQPHVHKAGYGETRACDRRVGSVTPLQGAQGGAQAARLRSKYQGAR